MNETEDRDLSVYAEFQSKIPHNTSWLEISYHIDRLPVDLLTELAAVDWVRDDMRGIPPMPDGRTELHVMRRGSGIFGLWSPEERKAAMRDARRVLKRHGLEAGSRKLTLQDLL